MKLRFTTGAHAQFHSALHHIARDKPLAAERMRSRTLTALDRLIMYLESGRVLKEFPDSPYREVIVSPYRFVYRMEKNVVAVVGVWHSAQLPEEPGQE
ncbi:MAG: plasmid stabilization system protein [Bacteroidetes bacterium CG12_big_fil_rev_8_21_14_0_65_60_17]|nr:MAG: plasmid stabilization system protein [Bacteroidetes bacterium CG12_big_fil_rev_8_21_14_0_65_60_17]